MLVLDNASYHTSTLVRKYLREMESTLEPVWLPPYCPELNDIERIWKYVKGAAVANHDFGNVKSLREAVKLAFEGLNESQEGGLTLSFRDPSARDLGKAA